MEKLNTSVVQSNIEKIGKLFPELLVECRDEDGELLKRIDLEKLAILCGEINVPFDEFEYQFRYVERYTFDWPGKKMAIAEAIQPSAYTLRPHRDESIHWEQANNLYIEGDNLEALKLLQNSYHKSIQMIYIDPPYNTGKSFIYGDNYKDGINTYLKRTNSMLKNHSQADGRYHADWLNMMYPRLKLARELLSDDGAIFISIEDNELSNLKRIGDEIFGEDNFVSIITVENNPKGRKNSRFISQSCDYCLIYAKDITKGSFVENSPKNVSEMKMDDTGKFVHKSGKRILVGYNDFNEKVENVDSEKHYSTYIHLDNYDLIFKKENDLYSLDQGLIDQGYKRYISYRSDYFVENTYTMQKLQSLFEDEALEIKDEKIYEKNFKNTTRMKNLLTSKKYTAVINGQELEYKMDVTTTTAGNTIKDLFETEKPLFSSPKPVDLIQTFITLFENKNITVMDFFAGSSTTGQAVWQQNMLDGGNRKFILVQIPEPIDKKDKASMMGYDTISQLGRARLDKVIHHLNHNNKDQKTDIGYKMFSISNSSIKNSTESEEKFQPIEACSKEDMLYELLLKIGASMTAPISIKCIENDEIELLIQEQTKLAICLNRELSLSQIRAIESYFSKNKKMKCYVDVDKEIFKEIDRKSILKRYQV